MALTGYVSDDDNVGRSEVVETEVKRGETAVKSELNSPNLEEHNKKMGEEIQECSHPGKEAKDETKTEVPPQVGAGLLFGLSGLLLGGPVLALLAGCGATIVATNNTGPAGDAARATGEFAIDAGSKVGEAAKEASEKHGIMEKIQNAFKCGWEKVQKFDDEHKATEKVKETVSGVAQKTVEIERKHHVAETILTGIHNGVNFLLEKLKDTTSSCNTGKENGKVNTVS